MTPASIELDELQLVPYRAPPMLELTCATVRDVSYWCVAELTSRSEASFIRATGSRERCDVVKHARRNQIGDSSFFYKYFLKLCLNLRTVKKMKIVIVEPATFE